MIKEYLLIAIAILAAFIVAGNMLLRNRSLSRKRTGATQSPTPIVKGAKGK